MYTSATMYILVNRNSLGSEVLELLYLDPVGHVGRRRVAHDGAAERDRGQLGRDGGLRAVTWGGGIRTSAVGSDIHKKQVRRNSEELQKDHNFELMSSVMKG